MIMVERLRKRVSAAARERDTHIAYSLPYTDGQTDTRAQRVSEWVRQGKRKEWTIALSLSNITNISLSLCVCRDSISISSSVVIFFFFFFIIFHSFCLSLPGLSCSIATDWCMRLCDVCVRVQFRSFAVVCRLFNVCENKCLSLNSVYFLFLVFFLSTKRAEARS